MVGKGDRRGHFPTSDSPHCNPTRSGCSRGADGQVHKSESAVTARTRHAAVTPAEVLAPFGDRQQRRSKHDVGLSAPSNGGAQATRPTLTVHAAAESLREYRELGRTGIRLSEIGFGAWAMGGDAWGPVDDANSIAAARAVPLRFSRSDASMKAVS